MPLSASLCDCKSEPWHVPCSRNGSDTLEKLKNEGRADQVKGKVQNVVGGIKDSMREADKK